MKLTPVAYGCDVEEYPLEVEAVDTHRPKPEVSDVFLILMQNIFVTTKSVLCFQGSGFVLKTYRSLVNVRISTIGIRL